MFIDEAEITVEAGQGGNGCRSYLRFRSGKKQPNGGDGGRGGHVILRADENIHSLRDFRYKTVIKAEGGRPGSSNNKTGKDGEDRIVKVPPGTLIYNADDKLLLRDLASGGDEVVVAEGGRPGRGNIKVPDAEEGQRGQSMRLYLELKLIADVGLIGFPNAGKSSLISCISKAKPKVAAYPFTTKDPVLGIVETNENLFKIADIPGLIEGAHQGAGLGDKFLRHVERTSMLIMVIDMAGVDGRCPWDDYKVLKQELSSYKQELDERLQLTVANKMDLPEAEDNLAEFKKRINVKEIIELSCKEKQGFDELIRAIEEKLQKQQKKQ